MIGGVLNAGGTGGGIKGAKIVTVQLTVDQDGNIIIPFATQNDVGAVKVKNTSGIGANNEGQLYLVYANEDTIDAKTNRYQPITAYMLDYAIKAGLMSNAAITTAAERKAICETVGALYGVKKLAAGSTTITQNDKTIDISAHGFTSAPYIFANYSDTGAWSGDSGAIKIRRKTTTSFDISIGGTGYTTARQVDWMAIEMQ